MSCRAATIAPRLWKWKIQRRSTQTSKGTKMSRGSALLAPRLSALFPLGGKLPTCSFFSSFFSFSFLLLFFFYNCIVSLGFRPWEIRVAFFSGESQMRQSRATQPTVLAGCFSVSIISLSFSLSVDMDVDNSDMDYRIFNVCTDFNACDCTRECADT